MTYKKLFSFIAGFTLLAAVFAPVRVGALSQASMTLSGATNTNGNFSVIVYENTGSDTVTGAKVELSFSQAVTSVSYDYSVGPFTATTPTGGQNAYGTVTGVNPVARVSFKLANPGSVTATVSTNSYLKRAEGATVQYFDINRGSAVFTYNAAPASDPSTDGGSAPSNAGSGSTASNNSTNTSTSTKKVATSNNTTSTAASDQTSTKSTTTGEVKDDATTKDDKKSDDDAKKNDEKKTSDNGSAWYEIIAMIIAASLAFLAGRRYRAHRLALKERMAQEAAAAAAAAKAKKASEKPAKKAADKPKKNSAKKKTKK